MSAPTWADIFDAVEYDASPSLPSEMPGWDVHEQDVADFGPTALDDETPILKCPTCSRLMLPEAIPYHRKNCRLVTDIKEARTPSSVLEAIVPKTEIEVASDDDDEDDKPLFMGVPQKKRKDESTGDEKPAKKSKTIVGRVHKGPVDVDRHCGVITEKGPCLRSLTCKSHSMGAKRAVPGRSAPYDELLLKWQKATNPAFAAKLEEKERAAAAATAARAAAAEEKAFKKKQKKAEQAAAAAAAKAAAQVQADADAWEREHGAANSTSAPRARDPNDPDADMYASGAKDAEVDAELSTVLAALRRSSTAPRATCMPLAARAQSSSFVTRSHNLLQYRTLIAHALRGRTPGPGVSSSLGAQMGRALNGNPSRTSSVSGPSKGRASVTNAGSNGSFKSSFY